MAQESAGVERWLFATLNGDDTVREGAPGGVHNRHAPQNRQPPYVVFRPEGGNGGGEDVNTLGLVRGVVERFYDVFVVGKDCGFDALQQVADRIDALLHGAQRLDADPRFVVERVTEIRDEVQETGLGGPYYYESGGTYRFLITPEG